MQWCGGPHHIDMNWTATHPSAQHGTVPSRTAPHRAALHLSMPRLLACLQVQRIELRAGLSGNLTYSLDGTEHDASVALRIWLQAAAVHNLSIGFIHAPLRTSAPTEVARQLDAAKALQAEFGAQALIGFDLVGQEDPGKTLLEFKNVLLAGSSPALPYVFHAGETKYAGAPSDGNLYDSLLLNASRIGHGFALRNHPQLRAEVKRRVCRFEPAPLGHAPCVTAPALVWWCRRGVAIEVCPISNQVLGLMDDFRNHPLPLFVSEGLPIVISSDDPGFWQPLPSPLSYDWWVAFVVAGERCGGIGLLKQLALNAIRYSLASASEQATMTAAWLVRWDSYVDWLLSQSVTID